MADGWRWDETLFEGAAAHYARGRLPYAPGYAETLATALGLDQRSRLLDVGCGPGTVTLPMAPFVGEAIGLDPDPGMLAEARRQAGLRGVTNVRWVAGRAEDLPGGLGAFQAVVFAQSFHWTDRDRVAATVFRMLAPGGAFVQIGDVRGPAAPPYAKIGDLVRRYLGPVRRAGQGVLVNGTPGREDLVLARAGFGAAERVVVPAGEMITRTADDLVAWTFSRSDSAPHLFGDRLADFERDLRALLGEGPFPERLPATEIRLWRPAQHTYTYAHTEEADDAQ
ncbi:class I SAM-dependent methyltransferase [Herbidospora galbida]|uniref:Class I SAM-dependent methyltransferase n=1 Tax=Herbidospora galbida TaxID=2575442 RepID=A0A4U3M6H4_9ACTN|nr:class I SAM-dependent methyltransferase [Herbidospora galbida]TKK84518.1 class I SAM-dependent methyltransferase [Herbidospora galbida]